MIKNMTGSQSDIALVPYDKAYEAGFEDMQRRLPDISKLQRLTGYQPTLNLLEILKRIIAYERERVALTPLP
jgi:UDP-glucose 4-epimerase